MTTIIIIPCYNEAERLNDNQFIKFANDNTYIKFLFVNDGSTDNTLNLLNSMATQSNNISVLDLKTNHGKANAIRAGVLHSLQFTPQYIGYWDADLATPLETILDFLAIINNDTHILFIMGARFLRLGADIHRKWTRFYIGRIFATLASLALRLKVYDTQAGCKIIRSDLAAEIFQEKLISKWVFDVELIFRAKNSKLINHKNHPFYEHPLLKWEDVSGSKLKIIDFLKAPYELINLWRKY